MNLLQLTKIIVSDGKRTLLDNRLLDKRQLTRQCSHQGMIIHRVTRDDLRGQRYPGDPGLRRVIMLQKMASVTTSTSLAKAARAMMTLATLAMALMRCKWTSLA